MPSPPTRVTDTHAAGPEDGEHGALRLWFVVDERKMIFETKYRFVEE